MQVADLADFYDKHADALIRFAATVVGPSHAEDMVSEALLGILRSSPSEVSDLRAYFYRSVLNAGRKYWRSEDRRARRELRVAIREVVQLPEVDYAIMDALAGLSPRQRAVVHLTYWEDLTPAAVGARLGVSDGTVRRQLARARRRLAEVLDGTV